MNREEIKEFHNSTIDFKEKITEFLEKRLITPFAFSDIIIRQGSNVNGNTIEVSCKALFKFEFPDERVMAMATIDYCRNTGGSPKKYVSMNIKYHIEGMEFRDTVNFVADSPSADFYTTKLSATKLLFYGVEELIEPIMKNFKVSILTF
jgi:hypothetical protein